MDPEAAMARVADYLGIPVELIDSHLDGIDLDAAVEAVQAAAEPLDWGFST